MKKEKKRSDLGIGRCQTRFRSSRSVKRTTILVEVLVAIDEHDRIERVDYPRNVTENRQKQANPELDLQKPKKKKKQNKTKRIKIESSPGKFRL